MCGTCLFSPEGLVLPTNVNIDSLAEEKARSFLLLQAAPGVYFRGQKWCGSSGRSGAVQRLPGLRSSYTLWKVFLPWSNTFPLLLPPPTFYSFLYPRFHFLFTIRIGSFHSTWSVWGSFSNITNSLIFFFPQSSLIPPSCRDHAQNYISFTISQHFAFVLQIIFYFVSASPSLSLGLQSACIFSRLI